MFIEWKQVLVESPFMDGCLKLNFIELKTSAVVSQAINIKLKKRVKFVEFGV